MTAQTPGDLAARLLTERDAARETVRGMLAEAREWDLKPGQFAGLSALAAHAFPGSGDLEKQLAEVTAECDKAYRERAALVAYLAACYGGTLAYSDSDDEWPVIFIETPAGQMSWHIAEDDVELFRALGLRVTVAEAHWDGHTTAEKYERLAELTRTVATGVHGPQPTADLNENTARSTR